MIVVSDTTPINYLLLLKKEHILPDLFSRVIVPGQVLREMMHPEAPKIVRAWASSPAGWIDIKEPAFPKPIPGLDAGENAAINIGVECNVDAILIDDRRGIKEAAHLGLNSITLFALFELASMKRLIHFEGTIAALAETSYYMPPQTVIDDYLERNRST